jgi:uncharacterized membrane protein YoaK (UPF0700 family)
MKTQWKIGVNTLIGIWFLITPWALHFTTHLVALWTSVVIGAIQILASLLIYADGKWRWASHLTWVCFVCGLWFIAQPFVYHMQNNTGLLWNFVVLGAITAVLSLWYGLESNSTSKAHGSGLKTAS